MLVRSNGMLENLKLSLSKQERLKYSTAIQFLSYPLKGQTTRLLCLAYNVIKFQLNHSSFEGPFTYFFFNSSPKMFLTFLTVLHAHQRQLVTKVLLDDKYARYIQYVKHAK